MGSVQKNGNWPIPNLYLPFAPAELSGQICSGEPSSDDIPDRPTTKAMTTDDFDLRCTLTSEFAQANNFSPLHQPATPSCSLPARRPAYKAHDICDRTHSPSRIQAASATPQKSSASYFGPSTRDVSVMPTMLSAVRVVVFLLPAVFSHHVGFTMTRGHAQGPYVSFKRVVTNENADVNPSMGTFRCREPGLYFFSFEAATRRRRPVILSLQASRAPVVTMYSSETGSDAVAGSIVLRLREDDVVYPYIEEGEIIESDPQLQAFTSFTGFRISKEAAAAAAAAGDVEVEQTSEVRNGTKADVVGELEKSP
ncbi:complement C1q protein 3-like [Tropilaelaps mercedesae]|uniref:Complement C1q protein 3-like n=1 Tax=Tropilaelaps mercedesae TaxID=418985 RepID=A0A1V9XWC0_9ACAR|nr:complement C1q protein 3-like [Tropilaelaps mercedesae]